MTMYELTNRSAALHKIPTDKSKENDQVVKYFGTVCAKLVETDSYACAMFAVNASNLKLFFAPCLPSGKMMTS